MITKVNFTGHREKRRIKDSKMSADQIKERQAVKDLILKGEELDYFVRNYYGIKTDISYKTAIMRQLHRHLEELKVVEKNIIKILQVNDESFRNKHDIGEKGKYTCPILKDIHNKLENMETQNKKR